jgi:hypothetical protein
MGQINLTSDTPSGFKQSDFEQIKDYVNGLYTGQITTDTFFLGGDPENPVDGDQRIFNDSGDIRLQTYDTGAWSDVMVYDLTANEVIWDGSDLVVGGDILPLTGATHSLGSDTVRWNEVWITGSSLHIGNSDSDTIIKFTNELGSVLYLDGQSGLDDLTNSGIYTEVGGAATYQVVIDGVGSPNTFKWRKNYGSWTEGVSMTGSAQLLSDGISITWGATTGHSNKDEWIFGAGYRMRGDKAFSIGDITTVDGAILASGSIDALGSINIAGGIVMKNSHYSAPDGSSLKLGDDDDFVITHDGTDCEILTTTGNLKLDNTNVTGEINMVLGTDSTATSFNVQNDSLSDLFTVKGNGDIVSGNSATFSLTRTVPTVVDDIVEIGNFAITGGARSLWVSIIVDSATFSVAKQYIIPTAYNETGGSWHVVNPISNSGIFSTNDLALDIKVSTNTAYLRIRRTGGSTAGTAYVVIKHDSNITSDTFTPTTGTDSVTAPTDFYESAVLTQVNGYVGVGIDTPVRPLHTYDDSIDMLMRLQSGDSKVGLELQDDSSTVGLFNEAGVFSIDANNSGIGEVTVSTGGVGVTVDLAMKSGDIDMYVVDPSATQSINFRNDTAQGATTQFAMTFTDDSGDGGMAMGGNAALTIQSTDSKPLYVTTNSTDIDPVLDLRNTGTNAGIVEIYTGDRTPLNNVTPGSDIALYFRDDTTNSAMYIANDQLASTWAELFALNPDGTATFGSSVTIGTNLVINEAGFVHTSASQAFAIDKLGGENFDFSVSDGGSFGVLVGTGGSMTIDAPTIDFDGAVKIHDTQAGDVTRALHIGNDASSVGSAIQFDMSVQSSDIPKAALIFENTTGDANGRGALMICRDSVDDVNPVSEADAVITIDDNGTGITGNLEVTKTSAGVETIPLQLTNSGGATDGSAVGIVFDTYSGSVPTGKIYNERHGAGDYSLNFGTFSHWDKLILRQDSLIMNGDIHGQDIYADGGSFQIYHATGNTTVNQWSDRTNAGLMSTWQWDGNWGTAATLKVNLTDATNYYTNWIVSTKGSDGSLERFGVNDGGDFYVKDDALYVDYSADRVGVGTGTPEYPLHVSHASAGYALIETDLNGGDTGLLFRNSVGENGYVKGGVFFKNDLSGNGRGDLYFALNNISDTSNVDVADAKMTIRRTGNVEIGADLIVDTDTLFVDSSTDSVGIGDLVPLSPLHISKSVDGSLQEAIRVCNPNTTTGTATGMMFSVSPEGQDYAKAGIFFESDLGIGWARGDMIFALDNASDTADVSLADEKMRLSREGDLTVSGDITQNSGESVVSNPTNVYTVTNATDLYNITVAMGTAGTFTVTSDTILNINAVGNFITNVNYNITGASFELNMNDATLMVYTGTSTFFTSYGSSVSMKDVNVVANTPGTQLFDITGVSQTLQFFSPRRCIFTYFDLGTITYIGILARGVLFVDCICKIRTRHK